MKTSIGLKYNFKDLLKKMEIEEVENELVQKRWSFENRKVSQQEFNTT